MLRRSVFVAWNVLEINHCSLEHNSLRREAALLITFKINIKSCFGPFSPQLTPMAYNTSKPLKYAPCLYIYSWCRLKLRIYTNFQEHELKFLPGTRSLIRTTDAFVERMNVEQQIWAALFSSSSRMRSSV